MCSNIFITSLYRAPAHQYWLLVAIEARTVDKRAVRIALEYFLVFTDVYTLQEKTLTSEWFVDHSLSTNQ